MNLQKIQRSQESRFTGTGRTNDGYYFTNGKGIHVTWKKTSDFAPTKFYDDNGNEIEINPGKTNICVVEQGKSIDAE